MFLVDTTVWIDYFNNKNTPQTIYLIEAIKKHTDICVCGIILTEILQGISDPSEYKQTLESLEILIFLPTEKSTYLLSAEIYRKLRTKGITIRKTIDCLIAAVALENHVSLLHNDKYFNPIEKHLHLEIIKLNS